MMLNLKRLVLLCGVSLLVGDICPCAAQSSGNESGVSASVGAAVGIRRYVPGRWGLIQVKAVNRTDEPAEATTVAFFSQQPGVQFARQLWLPAHSARLTTCPILAPENLPDGKESANITWAQFNVAGSRETLTKRLAERMLGDVLVAVNSTHQVTAIMNNREDSGADSVTDMALAMRFHVMRYEALAPIHGDFAPEVAEGYDGLDQLVLADDRLAFDSAGTAALRHWVLDGGRLWVMLDRVDPAMVELLLADAFRCEVVDRVGLTEVLVKSVEDAESEFAPIEDTPREFEEPVDLVRVLVEDVEVTHTVHGWPAAFRRPLGRGEVFFTTLGAPGWLRQKTPEDSKLPQNYEQMQFRATAALATLANDYMRSRNKEPGASEHFEPFLAQRIGYTIVSRSTVMSLLGGFCLTLVVTGICLTRRGRLEWLGVIGPCMAIVVGTVLVLLGMQTRNAVPPTVAELQIVDVMPGGYDAQVTGLTSLYRQNPSSKQIHAARGGVLMPDMTGLQGTTRRMVWTDFDSWTWSNLTLPGGIRTAEVHYGTLLDEPVVARAAFGPRGLEGSLASGPFQAPGDAILVTPWMGNLATSLQNDGSFACEPDDLLAPGQFLVDALLDDQQREHQSIYALLDGQEKSDARPAATLLFWENPLDTRFVFSKEDQRTGSALVRVPLEIERSVPGSEVVVPSPFLPYRAVRGPDGTISAAYHRMKREWLPRQTASETWLRFQVPKETLPLEPNKATLTMRIEAPSRTLEILGRAGDRVISLATRQSPAGVITFVFDRSAVENADLFALDERGGFTLGFSVGSDRPIEAEQNNPLAAKDGRSWKIDSLRLDLYGRAVGVEQL